MVGIKVKHRFFGEGTILEISEDRVTVEFKSGKKALGFPSAFESHLAAVDPEDQKKITDYINEVKEAAEKAKEAEEAARKAAAEAAKVTAKFGEDYHAEHLSQEDVYTYQRVETEFGIQISGYGRGINVTDDAIVLISSVKEESGAFVYHDRWTKDGDFIYSGEGARGDQKKTKGNRGIIDAAKDGKKIHLFVKLSPQEYFYQGIFELVEYTYEDDKDVDGNIHKEYKFRLRRV